MKSQFTALLKLVLFLLLILLNAHQKSFANSDGTKSFEVKQIQVGFNGLYKVGRWVPVAVELTTDAPVELQLSVVSLSPDGNPTETPSNDYKLLKPGTFQLQSQFKAGLLDCPLKIRIRDPKTQSILEEISFSPQSTQNQFSSFGLKQSVSLWATVGRISGFEPVKTPLPTSFDRNVSQLTALIPDQSILPDTDRGYDSLDSLIVNSDYVISPEKNKAIQNWVSNGGHLVVQVGSNIEKYKASEFAKWIPVKILGVNRIRELSSLELFASVRSRIRGVATGAQIEIDSGEVLASSLNGPLLVRVPYGLGVVTFLALDLDKKPLVNWEGLKSLCSKIATKAKSQSADNQQKTDLGKRLSQTGVSELETQLFYSQQNFPQIQRPSHWWVMGLILFYLLIIGPLDYFLVHRILKKPHITWITFPVMVLLAAAWGVTTAQTDNGNSFLTTQLNLVDYDAASGQFRGRLYLGLYSPETRRYQIDVQSTLPVNENSPEYFPTDICWHGLPESTFAGMYRSAEGTITGPAYRFSDQSHSIQNLPILKWGTKNLTAEWSQQHANLFSANLTGNSLGQLTGNLQHQFSSSLKDWMLAYGNRIYLPIIDSEQPQESYIPPNQPWDINNIYIESRNIKGYLTRVTSRRIRQRGKIETTLVTEQTEYDPFSKDEYEIIKMLTYHDISGGSRYTGLLNSSAEQSDFSEQLRLGRAVLFARIDTPLSQVTLDDQKLDQSNQTTYIRVVIPVTKSNVIQYELPSLDDDEKEKQPKDQKDSPSGSIKE